MSRREAFWLLCRIEAHMVEANSYGSELDELIDVCFMPLRAEMTGEDFEWVVAQLATDVTDFFFGYGEREQA